MSKRQEIEEAIDALVSGVSVIESGKAEIRTLCAQLLTQLRKLKPSFDNLRPLIRRHYRQEKEDMDMLILQLSHTEEAFGELLGALRDLDTDVSER